MSCLHRTFPSKPLKKKKRKQNKETDYGLAECACEQRLKPARGPSPGLFRVCPSVGKALPGASSSGAAGACALESRFGFSPPSVFTALGDTGNVHTV